MEQTPQSLHDQIDNGIQLLKNGGIIAFPTDTLYGIGANPFITNSLERIIAIKGRPTSMGMPLLLANIDQLPLVARNITDEIFSLALQFWPGALTMVVPSSSSISQLITGGRDSVAVRIPDHPVPIALSLGLEKPITGTSANLWKYPPASTAEEAEKQLGSKVDSIIYGGQSPKGTQSTIIDVTGSKLKVIRHGAISVEQLASVYTGVIEELTK